MTSSCVGCRSTEVVVGVAAEVTDTTVVVVADVAGKTGMKEAILRSFFDDDDASASWLCGGVGDGWTSVWGSTLTMLT